MSKLTDKRLSDPLSGDAASCLASIECEVHRHLNFTLGHHDQHIDPWYLYRALAIAVRDRLIPHWKNTHRAISHSAGKRVYYLSLEFLVGRSLTNAILNLDLEDDVRGALNSFGTALEETAELEHDAGLGNGGLGRLAACCLDSCANLQLPVVGYGIEALLR